MMQCAVMLKIMWLSLVVWLCGKSYATSNDFDIALQKMACLEGLVTVFMPDKQQLAIDVFGLNCPLTCRACPDDVFVFALPRVEELMRCTVCKQLECMENADTDMLKNIHDSYKQYIATLQKTVSTRGLLNRYVDMVLCDSAHDHGRAFATSCTLDFVEGGYGTDAYLSAARTMARCIMARVQLVRKNIHAIYDVIGKQVGALESAIQYYIIVDYMMRVALSAAAIDKDIRELCAWQNCAAGVCACGMFVCLGCACWCACEPCCLWLLT